MKSISESEGRGPHSPIYSPAMQCNAMQCRAILGYVGRAIIALHIVLQCNATQGYIGLVGRACIAPHSSVSQVEPLREL